MATEITELNHSTRFSHIAKNQAVKKTCFQLENSYRQISYIVATEYIILD